MKKLLLLLLLTIPFLLKGALVNSKLESVDWKFAFKQIYQEFMQDQTRIKELTPYEQESLQKIIPDIATINLSDSIKKISELDEDKNRELLGLSAYHNLVSLVQISLEYGEVNCASKNEALILAASECHKDIIKLLLYHGADVNSINYDKLSPLIFAAREGNRDLVELFLDYGAEVDHTNWVHRTALMYAVALGHTAIVKLLLDRGAAVNHSDIGGCTALYYAASHECTDIITLLLDRGATINHVSSFCGNTPLFWAVWEGNTNAVAVLLNRGATINHADNKGNTPLIWAGIKKNSVMFEFLLQHGANINHINNRGEKAINPISNNCCSACIFGLF